MNVWINKCVDEGPADDFKDAYVFSVKKHGGVIFTGLNDVWLQMGRKEIPPLYEDLFIIGLSIFAIDKRIPRRTTHNCWTRDLKVSIPVIEIQKWNIVKEQWESMLSFLTGDNWEIIFRKSEDIFSKRNRISKKRIDFSGCTCVSLFSGGLDSFCGAIELLEKGESPCLVGHNEYPKLRMIQKNLCDMFCEEYSNQKSVFISFTANSKAPYKENEKLLETENTSRGRSLLFLCAAVTIAGIIGEGTPIYVPENGFIGLNIPLTNNRKGSCSTRTTHLYFIKTFNKILETVKINHNVINFFAFESKKNIVQKVKDTKAFAYGAAHTISCSHPCLPRYKRDGDKTYPKNCGYCYPCIIRKCSMLGLERYDSSYSEPELSFEFFEKNINRDITNDMAALISSLYRYIHIDDTELIRLIKNTGPLKQEDVTKFVSVYKNTMTDLKELLYQDEDLKKYIGDK